MKIKQAILLMIISHLFVYMWGVFITLKFDIFSWDEPVRIIIMFVSVCITTTILFNVIYTESINKNK